MARLEEIREKLYRPDFKESAPPKRDIFGRRSRDEKAPKSAWSDSASESGAILEQAISAGARERRFSRRIFFAAATLIVLGVAAFIGYRFFFAPAEVVLSVDGPRQVSAGDISVFVFRISNQGSAALTEGTLSVNLPAGAVFAEGEAVSSGISRKKFDVEDVPPGRTLEREIRLRFFGPLGQSQTISASYLYRPENIQSKLIRSAEFSVGISRAPLVISFDVPEKVSSGQEMTITVSVDSGSAVPFSDLSLGVEFPSGFAFGSSDPPLDKGAEPIWPLGQLEAGQSRKILLKGKIQGEAEEVKPFLVRVGRYQASSRTWLILAEETARPAIASPFLLIRATLNSNRSGSLAPASQLNGSVFFKNNLPQKVQNIVIRVAFPEELVTLSSVRVERGFYDVTRRAITYDPSSEPRLRELDVGEEGVLAFSFALKDNPPIRVFNDKNFVFWLVSGIDSLSPPPEYRGVALGYEDRIELKIESRLILAGRAAYYDSPAAASGPLPPKVRETTTYTLWLQLSSGANDLREVEVRGELGGGVEWLKVLRVDTGEVNFNPASRQFVWRIGGLPAATGILRPHAAAAAQVAFRPAENQINTSPDLLRNISASGVDVFTNAALSDTIGNLTIELRQDARSSYSEWRVVE